MPKRLKEVGSRKQSAAEELKGSNMSHVSLYFSPQHNAISVSVAKCLCQGKCINLRPSKSPPSSRLYLGTLPSKRFDMQLALELKRLLIGKREG